MVGGFASHTSKGAGTWSAILVRDKMSLESVLRGQSADEHGLRESEAVRKERLERVVVEKG